MKNSESRGGKLRHDMGAEQLYESIVQYLIFYT